MSCSSQANIAVLPCTAFVLVDSDVLGSKFSAVLILFQWGETKRQAKERLKHFIVASLLSVFYVCHVPVRLII